jgi:ABC-type transport system involved in multi-copper enzyme maturation permease subunit
MTWSNTVLFALTVQLLRRVIRLLLPAGVLLATAPVMEIETGFIDLLLTRPVDRRWIMIRSILVTLISTLWLLGMMALGTSIRSQ